MKTMGTRLKELRMNAGYTGEEVGRMLKYYSPHQRT